MPTGTEPEPKVYVAKVFTGGYNLIVMPDGGGIQAMHVTDDEAEHLIAAILLAMGRTPVDPDDTTVVSLDERRSNT